MMSEMEAASWGTSRRREPKSWNLDEFCAFHEVNRMGKEIYAARMASIHFKYAEEGDSGYEVLKLMASGMKEDDAAELAYNRECQRVLGNR